MPLGAEAKTYSERERVCAFGHRHNVIIHKQLDPETDHSTVQLDYKCLLDRNYTNLH